MICIRTKELHKMQQFKGGNDIKYTYNIHENYIKMQKVRGEKVIKYT